jgi:hypothetical protein
MLEISACRVLAEQRLVQIAGSDSDFVMLDQIVERGLTVAFFYQSAEYVKTSNSLDALAGNGPILVNRATGAVGTAGTALPLEDYVKDFEVRTMPT